MKEKELTALVIDDDMSWLQTLCRLAKKVGYKTLTASFYNEAIELINKFVPDFVITDIRLVDDDKNNDDGLQILKYMKKNELLKESIIVTGYPTYETKKIADELGVLYFKKGQFSKDEFQSELNKSKKKLLSEQNIPLRVSNQCNLKCLKKLIKKIYLKVCHKQEFIIQNSFVGFSY